MAERHFADHITTETGEEVRIEIHDSSFGGSATKLQGTGSGWASRSVQQLDVREPLSNPIQKSEVSATLWLTSSSLIDDLFSSEEGRFTLIYKKDSTEYFEGEILPDLCDYEYLEDDALWKLTVKAKDLSGLSGEEYALDTGRVTIIEAISDMLPFSKTIKTHTSWIVAGETAANDYLRQVYLDKFALRTYARTGDETDEPITKLEALEWILKSNGLILYQENGWVLDHITAMDNPASVLESNYDSAGAFVSASNVDLTSTAKITLSSKYNHNPGIKSARLKYDHRTKISGIVLPEFVTISTGGGSESYEQFIQSDGTQTISFYTVVDAEVNDATISQGDDGFAVFKLQAGSYYWDGDEWTLTDSEFQKEIIGLPQGGDDWVFGGIVSIETDPLPAAADGDLVLTFLQGEYVVGAVTSVFDEIVYKRSSISINNPIAEENSTYIDYQLTQSGDQSVRVDYGSIYFGDGPTGYSRGGYSTDSSGNTYTSDDWARRGEVAFVNHAQVLLREVIDVQRKTRKRISATVKSALSFGDIVAYDSTNYYVLGGSYDGYTGVSSVELLEINIVTGADTFEDLPKFEEAGTSGTASTPSSGGLDVGTADARYFKQVNLFSEIATGDQNTAIGNIGITATKAELNILDGALVSTAELNTLEDISIGNNNAILFTDGVGDIVNDADFTFDGTNFTTPDLNIGTTTVIDSSRNAFFEEGTFGGFSEFQNFVQIKPSSGSAFLTLDGNLGSDSVLRFREDGLNIALFYHDTSSSSIRVFDYINNDTAYLWDYNTQNFLVNGSADIVGDVDINSNIALNANGTSSFGGVATFEDSIDLKTPSALGNDSALLDISFFDSATEYARIEPYREFSTQGWLKFYTRVSDVMTNTMTLRDDALSLTNDIELTTGDIGTDNFALTTDFSGTGWQGTYAGDFNINNLVVRSSARFRELIIDQLAVIAGSDLRSVARGKILTVNNTTKTVTLDNPNNISATSFVGESSLGAGDGNGDFFWIKEIDIDGGTFLDLKGQITDVDVSTVSGEEVITLTLDTTVTGGTHDGGTTDLSALNGGEVIVQRGHPTDTDRQALIYTTVSDSDAPVQKYFTGIDSLDAFDAVANITTQIGNLEGLTSTYANVTGEGFYSSNAYLTDSILVGDLSKTDNYLEYDGVDLTVNADNFLLDATTLLIDSSASSGKIALGANVSTINVSNNDAGVYADGNGEFKVQSDDNNYIKATVDDLSLATTSFDIVGGDSPGEYTGMQSGTGTDIIFFGGAQDMDGDNALFYVQADGSVYSPAFGKTIYSSDYLAGYAEDDAIQISNVDSYITTADTNAGANPKTLIKAIKPFTKRFSQNVLRFQGFLGIFVEYSATPSAGDNSVSITIEVVDPDDVSVDATDTCTELTYTGTADMASITYEDRDFEVDVSGLTDGKLYYVYVKLTAEAGATGAVATCKAYLTDMFSITAET